MRSLSIAVLVLALTAPAALGAPFGKPRTLGTTPLAYEYSSLFSADGPRGGVAFYVVGEKQVGLKITQRLYVARVEGNGRTHGLTITPVRAPGSSGDAPYLDLAVGPHWRMLTTELRATRVYGMSDVYGIHIAPNGRRVGAHRVGPSNHASPFFVTNARGDAIARFDNGLTIARAAGRFARAPKALRIGDYLPYLAADGSLYDWRVTGDGGRAIAHSSGSRWGKPQSIYSGPDVNFHQMASSPSGDALLVYGTGDGPFSTTVIARWRRRGRSFGAPIQLTPPAGADPFSVLVDAIPGGRFAVRWRDGHGVRHLARAGRPGGALREVVSWHPPESADLGILLPLRDGRTVVVWEIHDRDGVKPDRLRAAVINPKGKFGPAQTIAVSERGADFDGLQLRRVGRNRAALVYAQRHGGKKRIRIALTRG